MVASGLTAFELHSMVPLLRSMCIAEGPDVKAMISSRQRFRLASKLDRLRAEVSCCLCRDRFGKRRTAWQCKRCLRPGLGFQAMVAAGLTAFGWHSMVPLLRSMCIAKGPDVKARSSWQPRGAAGSSEPPGSLLEASRGFKHVQEAPESLGKLREARKREDFAVLWGPEVLRPKNFRRLRRGS